MLESAVQQPSQSRPCPACDAAETSLFGEKNSYSIVRCKRCFTLYTAERVEAVYEDSYQTEAVPVPPFLANRLDRTVESFASFRRSGRLLDVGFGGGDLLDAASRAGWIVSGVEVVPAAVNAARQRGIDAVLGTLAQAQYVSESFDVVLATEILEHLIEVGSLLDEIRRVLRKGGMLWITTPHGRGLSARLLGTSWSVIAPPEHVQLFSVRGIRQLLARHGFQAQVATEGTNPQELLNAIRSRPVSSTERVETAYAVNAYFEGRPMRRAVKRSVNRTLSLLRLGDSLKVRAIRQ